jgi:FkbM family methyltransferase
MHVKQAIKNFFKTLIIRSEILEKWFGVHEDAKEFYGQFGEDAILQQFFINQSAPDGNWEGEKEVLKDHFFLHPGFYVDIGCYNPTEISNTYWFYKRGWRGINVDLSAYSIEISRAIRPNDIHLQAAITQTESEQSIPYFEFGPSSVFNTLNREQAEEIAKNLQLSYEVKEVKALSLKNLLESHLPENQKIDFFSIDVEGHDLEVLKSNDWSRFRPKAIVIEIHEPDLESLLKHPVSQFLIEKGYQIFAWPNPSVIFIEGK